MHRLLYISTAKRPLTDAEVATLLDVSRRNNAAVDVTGLLIIGGRRFLQALEGPEAAVAQTYDRIQRDPRHFGIVQLSSQTVDSRAFGSWAMGSQSGGSPSEHAQINQAVAALIAQINDPNIKGYFRGFIEARAAA